MFVDEATISVKGGSGGRGSVAFRREKCEPMGGPSGGDGGNGGSVIVKVDPGLRTLMDFRHRRHFFAEKGGDGQKKNMTGRNGADMYIRVPAGTVIKNGDGEIVADLTEDGQQAVLAAGGKGGKGNAHFASATNRSPRFAQQGEPTEEAELSLELKLLADVAIIGLPNAGKSTLINRMSTAKAKVGDYPFTTKTPNLGMVVLPDDRDFVVADIPGLVENAHLGKGMGIQFLKHVERASILVHIVDLTAGDRESIMRDYALVEKELASYSADLATRPVIVVGSKIDLPEAAQAVEGIKEAFRDMGVDFMPISAATGDGVDALKYAIADRLASQA